MTFRNNTEAENLRLRNQLREAQEKLAQLEAEKEEKEILPKSPGWLASKLAERRAAKAKKLEEKWLGKPAPKPRRRGSMRNSFGRKSYMSHNHSSTLSMAAATFALCILVGVTGYATYTYCTDITEGTVVGYDYSPEEEICTYDEDHYRHCSTYGPYWYLTIQEGSERATWSVPKSDYDHYRIGDHYCYEDFFRGDCRSTTSQ